MGEWKLKFNKLAGYGVVGVDRCCGKSLALALGYISDALGNPGWEVPIIDHYPIKAADRNLLRTVQILIDQMNLKNMVVNVGKMTVQFDLYEDRVCPETVLWEGRIVKRFDIPKNLVYIGEAAYRII